MRFIYTLLLVIIVIVAVAFAVTNSDYISLYYYFDQINIPLSLALSISLALGSTLGILVCLKSILRSKYEIRNLKKEISLANKEISNLRSIPIKDKH